MKAWISPGMWVVLLVVAMVVSGCVEEVDEEIDAAPDAVKTEAQVEEVEGLPELVIDADAPLLLDETVDIAVAEAKADNSACFVCHANYREEPFAVHHAVNDVGCVVCHGDSFAHRNDENNTTPPEKMYPREKIREACKKCHEGEHKASADEVRVRKVERGLESMDASTFVCTDCHGNHRLRIRTVRWDKATGKLLPNK